MEAKSFSSSFLWPIIAGGDGDGGSYPNKGPCSDGGYIRYLETKKSSHSCRDPYIIESESVLTDNSTTVLDQDRDVATGCGMIFYMLLHPWPHYVKSSCCLYVAGVAVGPPSSYYYIHVGSERRTERALLVEALSERYVWCGALK